MKDDYKMNRSNSSHFYIRQHHRRRITKSTWMIYGKKIIEIIAHVLRLILFVTPFDTAVVVKYINSLRNHDILAYFQTIHRIVYWGCLVDIFMYSIYTDRKQRKLYLTVIWICETESVWNEDKFIKIIAARNI